MKTRIWFWLFFIAIVTSSCVNAGGQTPSDLPPSPIASQDDQEPVPSDSLIIDYTCSGGIAGTWDSWKVYADGRFLENDEQSNLDEEKLTAFITEIDSSGFFDLEFASDPFQMCADCYSYHLLVKHGNLSNEITWTDADSPLPESLVSVLELLHTFIFNQTNP
jgi:hypothetical protein